MKNALVFVLAIISLPLLGQSKFDALLDSAIQQYKRQAFQEAVATIRPIAVPVSKHTRMPEALFIYASAALQVKDFASASSAFQAFHEHFPYLNLSHEWLLLESDWCLARKKWDKALRIASLFDNWTDDDAFNNLFLNRCDNLPKDTLKSWLKKNPTWPAGNWLMVKQLEKKNSQDPAILAFRTKAWKVWNQQIATVFDSSRFLKSKFKIALLLPLELQQIKPEEVSRKNQSLLNFVSGFQMACESSKHQDSSFTTFLYDYQRSEQRLNTFLAEPELRGMDAFVGPVLPMGLETLIQLSVNSKLPVVNPIGFGVSFAGVQAPCYQLAGTPDAMAASAFRFGKSKHGITKTMVVYGTSPKDSLLARSFRIRFEKKGEKLTLFRKVGKNTAANLVKYLSDAGLDSSTFVFVPNNEPFVQVQLMAAIGLLQKKPTVLVPFDWLQLAGADYAQFEHQSIAFIGQFPVVEGLGDNLVFKKKYLDKTGIPASNEAWWGFEVGTALCRELEKGKSALFYQQHQLNEQAEFERTSMFQQSGDYQHFPVMRLVDGLPQQLGY